MNTEPDLHPDPAAAHPTEPGSGRQIVLEPMRPGLWLVIGGAVIAALGPLFGFLIGSMIGIEADADLDAIYLSLFVGIVVGGLGIGMALLGVRRLLRDRRRD